VLSSGGNHASQVPAIGVPSVHSMVPEKRHLDVNLPW
jgi:hypothetical protein